MTIYEKRAPKPRRGVGSVAATRKWRLAKDIDAMKTERLAREKKAATDFINRRKQDEVNVKLDPREWGKQVAFVALDQVVAVSRVADGLPDVHLSYTAWAERTQAYTDFKSVTIATGEGDLPNRDLMEEVPERIAVLKGMAYHEIGHIKYTYRPWNLFDTRQEQLQYMRVWNILEDQRMESRSVQTNARLPGILTIMVSRLIMRNDANNFGASPNYWILLAGRSYLPDEILWAAYNECPWEEDKREEWYQIVAEYKRARSGNDLFRAVVRAWEFLDENLDESGDSYVPDGVDDHAMYGDDGNGEPLSAEPSAEAGATDEEDGDSRPQPGKSAPLEITDQSLHDAVVNAHRDAVEEFAKRGEVQAAISRVNDVASASSFPPPPDNLQQAMNADCLATSMAMAEGMKKALSSFMTATDPYWENRQEVGVLDALAYRTKDVGARDYRRRRVDFEGKGRNVHVSLLCDISGSMHGKPMLALSMALYATALACDDLNIGRTLILWSTDYYQIWAQENPTPTVWNSCGGTQPTPALDTIEEHNVEEADNHLVLVFTDGEWYAESPLTTWSAPGRKIIVLHYGSYSNTRDLGADEEIHIQNVTDIPELLAQYIGDLIVAGD